MSSPNTLSELALKEKKVSHCHISTDVTYSFPGETTQNNHWRIAIHMEKWSSRTFHLLPLLKQSLSFAKLLNRSSLSSHKHTLEPAHTGAVNARLGDHWHNLQIKAVLWQEPPKLLYLQGRPYVWYNVLNALITGTYVANTKQPFWQEQTIFLLRSVELNHYKHSCWPGKYILRRTHISALLLPRTGENVPYYMQASSPYI